MMASREEVGGSMAGVGSVKGERTGKDEQYRENPNGEDEDARTLLGAGELQRMNDGLVTFDGDRHERQDRNRDGHVLGRRVRRRY